MHHNVKTDPKVFEQSWVGTKHWEIRNNDRYYKIGDVITLQETKFSGEEMVGGKPLKYTDRTINATITGIVSGYGLQEGWVILSLGHMVRFWIKD